MAANAFDLLKAGALTILALSGHLTLAVICVCAVLHGIIHAFSVPASYGMMPRFIARERLSSAIAVSSSYTQFAIFAGPAVAGWILVHWGIVAAFAANVAGYITYFAAFGLLRTPDGYEQRKSENTSFLRDVSEGLRYIIGHKGILALLLMMLAGDALVAAVYQLMPAYSDTALAAGVGGVSILLGAGGLGATTTALWLAQGGANLATPLRVLWAFLSLTVAVCGLAASPNLATAAIAMLAFGFAGETARTATVTILQVGVDDARRGRVMSTRFLFQQVAGGLGTLAIGIGAEHIGLRLSLCFAAAIALTAWVIAAFNRSRILASFHSAVEGEPREDVDPTGATA